MDTHGSVEEHIYMYIYAHTRNGYFSAPEKFPIMQSPQNKIEIESERKSITESECENVDKMEKHYRIHIGKDTALYCARNVADFIGIPLQDENILP
ncbi:protein phosphatase 2C, putative [Plasmodium ovale curtisi]|uniref:Protein phosphatase 2C, putative n=1 Tax=Plasmodium ovale curtisi TaxID=864141 RepID=A0A1A8WXA7_PLAOA|nr:protein phosphatase 2C, putative [Plasmodium ovale curtisi]